MGSGYFSFRSVRIGRNSRKLPGQPWKRTSGIALALVEKRATKWMVWVVEMDFGVLGEDGVGMGVEVVTVLV